MLEGEHDVSSLPLELPRADCANLLQKDLSSDVLFSICVIVSHVGEYFICYDSYNSYGPTCADLLDEQQIRTSGSDQTHVVPTTFVLSETVDAAALARKDAFWVEELRELDKKKPKAIPRIENISNGKITRAKQFEVFVQTSDKVKLMFVSLFLLTPRMKVKRHLAFLSEGRVVLKTAAKDVQERKNATQTKLHEVEERVKLLKEKAHNHTQVLHRVHSNDANLRERLEVLTSVLTEMLPTLTDAERKFMLAMKAKEKEVKQMQDDAAGLEAFVTSRPHMFSAKTALEKRNLNREVEHVLGAEDMDPEKLAVIQDHIDKQNSDLSELVSCLKELQASLV